MSGNDYMMFSHNRFAPGFGNIQNRTQFAFEQATSTYYRQFH